MLRGNEHTITRVLQSDIGLFAFHGCSEMFYQNVALIMNQEVWGNLIGVGSLAFSFSIWKCLKGVDYLPTVRRRIGWCMHVIINPLPRSIIHPFEAHDGADDNLLLLCIFLFYFFADRISLLCSLKAFELLLSIKDGLNYANASKSHHFLQAQRLLNQQIWYSCQNCLFNYIFLSLSNISSINL